MGKGSGAQKNRSAAACWFNLPPPKMFLARFVYAYLLFLLIFLNDFKYDDLFRNYQSIFNISISNNYDGKRLKNMLILANKVKKSEITEHEASVEVGTELVNNIVKPQLDKAGINSNK